MFFSKLKRLLEQRHHRKNLYCTAHYWDTKAQQMQGHAVSMWPNNCLNGLYHQEQLNLIINTLPDLQNKKLLDIGCGVGRLARWFAALGAIVTGIDFSKAALAIARRETAGENPRYRHLSMFDLNEYARYDTVCCWCSLAIAIQNRTELLQVMKKIHDALVSNGNILLLEPIHRGFLHRVLNMDLQEFITVMRETGFEIHCVKPLHFWPMRLLLAYVPWPKIFTVPLYYLGQFIMRLPGFNTMGDYHVIYAKRIR